MIEALLSFPTPGVTPDCNTPINGILGIIDEILCSVNFAPVSMYSSLSLSYDYFVSTGLSKIRNSTNRGRLLLSDSTPWL